MESDNCKPRLDEILIREGLISEKEIKEALLRQKAYGGKFGSQLLYHHYINESGLVKALATQFGCEGVVLSDIEIPEILLKMVPKKVAIARKVVPFDYDTENDILKIACDDPDDQNLLNELSFVCHRKNIELYVAAELALNTAIAKYYLSRDVSLDDNFLFEIPEDVTDSAEVSSVDETASVEETIGDHPAILILTTEIYSGPLLKSLLERDEYRVLITDEVDEAIRLFEKQNFKKILVNSAVCDNRADLTDRIRRISPGTDIRFYDRASSLLLDRECDSDDLLIKNLEMFTSLLASKEKLPINHGGRVAHYAGQLCRKLNIPNRDRLLICNAAYVHDLARFYYNAEDTDDNRQLINLTIKLFTSLNYTPIINDMLNRMYADMQEHTSQRLSLESLGGNILTIVDLFCGAMPYHNRLSLDKFDAIKKKLRDQIGKVFLPEVVDAFIEMIQEEILNFRTARKSGQVLIYTDDVPLQKILDLRLKNEGYGTVCNGSPDGVIGLYKRREPDLMILVVSGPPESILVAIAELADGDVSFRRTPTFLLTEIEAIPHLTGLLDQGIEDILSMDDNLDLLITKMRKLQVRRDEQSRNEAEATASGAHGRLADMNLTDLIQALGTVRKTVKITIIPGDPNKAELELYLVEGRITHASNKKLNGAEAVYEGLTWTDGNWMVEPIENNRLPDPNNELSIDAILMESCRLLDEKVKTGQLL